ncbi:MAG: hypothetical protein M1828_005149 [Chrysothrix sp. TS-e1954]|nr:MAG: hypothetical protein M1828_005149 [Chrysothrix sp. TS-e1954]
MRLRFGGGSPIRNPTASPPKSISRGVAFGSWICATFALVSIVLINIGGVSFGEGKVDRPRISNSGLELLSWYLSGDGSPSITNYYHYRLYLHRQCAVDRSSVRGEGACIVPHGIVGSFHISQGDPDDWVRRENPFDPVVGTVDFTPTFVCYVMAASALAVLVVVLPHIFLASEFARPSRAATRYSEICVTASAIFLILASSTITASIIHLRLKMEYVPQVSHIFQGNTLLTLTWTNTVAMMFAFLAVTINTRCCGNREVWSPIPKTLEA